MKLKFLSLKAMLLLKSAFFVCCATQAASSRDEFYQYRLIQNINVVEKATVPVRMSLQKLKPTSGQGQVFRLTYSPQPKMIFTTILSPSKFDEFKEKLKAVKKASQMVLKKDAVVCSGPLFVVGTDIEIKNKSASQFCAPQRDAGAYKELKEELVRYAKEEDVQ